MDALDGSSTVNAVAWPIASTALYVPIYFPSDETIYQLSFAANNGTGNYDLGWYSSALVRLNASGSVAMTAAGTKTLALGNLSVTASTLYYAALALSSTSGQVFRATIGAVRGMVAVGCGIEASALPLPPTATPVVVSSGFGGIVPLFSFGVR